MVCSLVWISRKCTSLRRWRNCFLHVRVLAAKPREYVQSVSKRPLPVLRPTSQQFLKSSRYSSNSRCRPSNLYFFYILASTAIWPSQSVWNFPTFSTVLPKKAEFHAFFWRLSCGADVILLAPTSICQIWSRLAGYEPLAGGLEQIKMAKNFEWIMMQVTGANQNT